MKREIGVIIITSCLLVLTLGACGNSQTTANRDLETVKITLERTECYGLCPVYTLTSLKHKTL